MPCKICMKISTSLLNHTAAKNSGFLFFLCCRPAGSVSMNFSVNIWTLSILSGVDVTQHLQEKQDAVIAWHAMLKNLHRKPQQNYWFTHNWQSLKLLLWAVYCVVFEILDPERFPLAEIKLTDHWQLSAMTCFTWSVMDKNLRICTTQKFTLPQNQINMDFGLHAITIWLRVAIMK